MSDVHLRREKWWFGLHYNVSEVSPLLCVCSSVATWVGGGFILGIAEATYNPTMGAVWALMPVPYVLTFFLGE